MNKRSTIVIPAFFLTLALGAAPASGQDWTSVAPLEDTWVGADDPHTTHSTGTTLALRGPMTKGDAKEAYLRFDVPVIANLSGVALRIQRENLAGSNVLEVAVLPDQDVDGLTWDTRPSGGTVIGSWSVAEGSGTEILDVTSGITLGAKQVLRLRLVQGAGSWGWGWIRSMEHGEPSTRPSLEIESIVNPLHFGCGFLEQGPGDCPIVWRQNSTGELYDLTDYGSFSVGCQIWVTGWRNKCNNLWDCSECDTCPGIDSCIWVLESALCSTAQAFDGCGTLLEDSDCGLVFRPDGSSYTYGLDDTGGYSAGCRVLVSGTIYETPCECFTCMGSKGCMEVDAIDVCPDAGCYDTVLTITDFEVTKDTDPPANCPDPYVDITLTSDGCTLRKFHSPTDKGVCPGESNSHQGQVFVAKNTRPRAVAWKAMDKDKGWFNDDDRMSESGFDLTPLEDENCGSHVGKAADVEICVEQNCNAADAGYSTLERTLPAFALPGDAIDVGLTLEVSGDHGSLVVLEELPEHFTFIDASPPPTGGGPVIDDGGDEIGFLLVWDVSGLADGEVASFQYSVQVPPDPQQFQRGFGTAVVQGGMQVVSGQDLEDAALGGVLYDCNGNGVDDSLDIADGSSNDFDSNGVPDECEQTCGAIYCETNVADIAIDTCDGSAGSINVDLSSGPPNQFVLLLVGNGNLVVSDPPGAVGDLCVVGGTCLGRYDKDIGVIGAAGTFSVDIVNSLAEPCAGGVTFTPGATWNFQYWHRQPMGQPATFSKALSVTFQ